MQEWPSIRHQTGGMPLLFEPRFLGLLAIVLSTTVRYKLNCFYFCLRYVSPNNNSTTYPSPTTTPIPGEPRPVLIIMSGFLSDIASWALGGGAAANNDPNANGQTTTNDDQQAGSSSATSVLTDDEMRAKRMARLAALENNAQKETDDSRGSGAVVAATAANEAVSLDASSSMDVDDKPKSSSTTTTTATNTKITTSSNPTTKNSMRPQPMDVDDDVKPTTVADNDVTMEESIPKKKIKSPPNTNSTSPTSTATSATVIAGLDPLAKLRRKKALLLRRVLLVTFGDISTSTDHRPSSSPSSSLFSSNSNNHCVHLTLDDDEMYNPTKSPTGVQPHHIAELLTARLSLSPKAHCLERTVPSQSKLGLIGYLGGCYKRACEEWREMKHEVSGGGGKKMLKKEEEDGFEEMCAILEQIKDQVSVLYFREI